MVGKSDRNCFKEVRGPSSLEKTSLELYRVWDSNFDVCKKI